MKIAIISDIHNNEVNLKKVLDYCAKQEIRTIICCGDLASLETLDFLNANFEGNIFYTFGNMDNEQLKDTFCHPEQNEGSRDSSQSLSASGGLGMTLNYKHTAIYTDFGKMEIDGLKIAFVHYPDRAADLCQTGKYNFVFYGHTHKPWISSTKNTDNQGSKKCTMLNPGNVAGEIYPPTFAVWDMNKNDFQLINIHQLL